MEKIPIFKKFSRVRKYKRLCVVLFLLVYLYLVYHLKKSLCKKHKTNNTKLAFLFLFITKVKFET